MAQQIASCALCGLPLGGERTGDAGDIDRPFNRIAAFGCSFVGHGADVAAEGELERLPLQLCRRASNVFLGPTATRGNAKQRMVQLRYLADDLAKDLGSVLDGVFCVR